MLNQQPCNDACMSKKANQGTAESNRWPFLGLTSSMVSAGISVVASASFAFKSRGSGPSFATISIGMVSTLSMSWLAGSACDGAWY